MGMLRAQETRPCEVPGRFAIAPGFFKGAVHVRGVIVPVVDPVLDVLALNPEQFNAAPGMNSAMDTGCITGIAHMAERMRALDGHRSPHVVRRYGVDMPPAPVH